MKAHALIAGAVALALSCGSIAAVAQTKPATQPQKQTTTATTASSAGSSETKVKKHAKKQHKAHKAKAAAAESPAK